MNINENNSWQEVYSTEQEYKIEILKAILNESYIKSYSINKKDSQYLFGLFELYVQGDEVMRAKLIIEKSDL